MWKFGIGVRDKSRSGVEWKFLEMWLRGLNVVVGDMSRGNFVDGERSAAATAVIFILNGQESQMGTVVKWCLVFSREIWKVRVN